MADALKNMFDGQSDKYELVMTSDIASKKTSVSKKGRKMEVDSDE